MSIIFFNTFLDILEPITMFFSTTTLRIFFGVGILNLVKENVVVDSHLNPYVAFLSGE